MLCIILIYEQKIAKGVKNEFNKMCKELQISSGRFLLP